ncbi:ATP-binding cassette domain-containing protein [Erysipelothrix enhydrae]|uniref:ABC transporter ATP-binding protein n=1 Tax=Erysipelothrix TaxID=1647 RepID=UPI002B24FF36|nr:MULTISPECIES: ATP-binding cassette domain-containing protein [Erysipelothrix]WRB86223.1 ATP-binding cassette domain-containing protein [Erysipelothrix sp. 4322-04]WRB93014.1 ATP-binding cassette domain-containing protein [Erysipelothrix rhusiopathiae]
MKLEFNQINKFFDEHHVLKDISFEVNSGQIFGYLGRNGAGKTTSIRILMDVFKSNSGSITMDGKPFNPEDYRIGYLPEERGMYSKTRVNDQLVYFAMLRGATRDEALTSVSYWAKQFKIEEYLDRKLETLSKGNQQKVQITQAFLNDPDILILDEPFSGLDPVNSQVFQDALTDYIADDKIIIFSSHQMSYVETFCDDIAIINEGSIVLNGSLNSIKKELGKDKIRIQARNYDTKELMEKLRTDLVSVESDEKSVIVSLSKELSKKSWMTSIIESDIDLKLLSDYEPSLQDIFVAKVGDHHE